MLTARRKLLAIVLSVATLLSVTTAVAGANDYRDTLFGRIRSVFEVVEAYHRSGADAKTFVKGAIKGGLEALGDPYTNYYDASEFGGFLDSLEGSFSGVGIYLEQVDNYVVISSPVKGGPAARAGLQTGDRILEANGVPLVGSGTEKAVSIIRGEPGTTVVLKIERPSESRTFTVEIHREVITLPDIEYRILENRVGYIQIHNFGSETGDHFFDAVSALKSEGAQTLVLDLRQNPGGYVHAAVQIAGAFIPAGLPVVNQYEKGDKITIQRSSGKLINMPTAVLIDKGSASASEILAGALQDHKVATLIGTNTFGKGTVQQILHLLDGGGMKVTIAEYRTPHHKVVDGKGLTPDMVLEQPKPDPERTSPMEYKRPLSTGSVGVDVLHLQYRLEDLGYSPENQGFFGAKTNASVRQFAIDNGLTNEPFVSSRFITTLNRKVAESLKQTGQQDVQLQKAVEVLRPRLK